MRILLSVFCLLLFTSPAWAQLDWLGSRYIANAYMKPEVEMTTSPFTNESDPVDDAVTDYTLTDHSTVRYASNDGDIASAYKDANTYTNHQQLMEVWASPSQNKVIASSWLDFTLARGTNHYTNSWLIKAQSNCWAEIQNVSGGWRKVKITYAADFGPVTSNHSTINQTPMCRMDYRTPQVTGWYYWQCGSDDNSHYGANYYHSRGVRHNAYGAMDAGTSDASHGPQSVTASYTPTKSAIVYLAPNEVLEISASVNCDGLSADSYSNIVDGTHGSGALTFTEHERQDLVEVYFTDLGAVSFPSGVPSDYDDGSTSGTQWDPSYAGTIEP